MNVTCSDKVKIDRVAGRRGHRTGAPVYKHSCPFHPLVCRWLSSVSTGTQAPPQSSGSLPPGPLRRAWEQVGAWSLFMADWATQAQWPPGSPGGSWSPPRPVIPSPTQRQSPARLPASGAPNVSPVSLPHPLSSASSLPSAQSWTSSSWGTGGSPRAPTPTQGF